MNLHGSEVSATDFAAPLWMSRSTSLRPPSGPNSPCVKAPGRGRDRCPCRLTGWEGDTYRSTAHRASSKARDRAQTTAWIGASARYELAHFRRKGVTWLGAS